MERLENQLVLSTYYVSSTMDIVLNIISLIITTALEIGIVAPF